MKPITEEQKQTLIAACEEEISRLKELAEQHGFLGNDYLLEETNNALLRQEIALAALSAVPVGFTFTEMGEDSGGNRYEARDFSLFNEGENYEPVYTAPPVPVCDASRDNIRREHAEWSEATFGNVGPVGPLKHLSAEALETADAVDDLSEWADMQFLLWDAQRRAGISDGQITQAMISKLAVNKTRKWPSPKDGEPRMHVKEDKEDE